jgi:hypothetical protein
MSREHDCTVMSFDGGLFGGSPYWGDLDPNNGNGNGNGNGDTTNANAITTREQGKITQQQNEYAKRMVFVVAYGTVVLSRARRDNSFLAWRGGWGGWGVSVVSSIGSWCGTDRLVRGLDLLRSLLLGHEVIGSRYWRYHSGEDTRPNLQSQSMTSSWSTISTPSSTFEISSQFMQICEFNFWFSSLEVGGKENQVLERVHQ